MTEEICGPAIERASGKRAKRDFFLGYSPERVNPGDDRHRLDSIVKVVAGSTPAVTDRLVELYGRVTGAGIHRAPDIRTAEAAKVIENAQRDINIAFMNEVAQIFSRIGVSVWDVLAAARTKWNFLGFEPGLVGGHCIGVDPYYLSHLAQQLGHDPQVGLDRLPAAGELPLGQVEGPKPLDPVGGQVASPGHPVDRHPARPRA